MIYLQYLKWGIIGLILLSAFILMPLFYNKWRDSEAREKQLTEYVNKKSTEVRHYKNELGKEVAKNELLELDRKSFKALQEEFSYLHKEFDGVKKNLRNVEHVTQITAQIIDSLKLPTNDTTMVINNEIVNVKTFDYQDDYNRVSGIVMKDSTSVHLEIEVPLDGVVYWERKWFLGKKIYTTEMTSKNSKVHITKLESIRVTKR